jgi:hypothetical protein
MKMFTLTIFAFLFSVSIFATKITAISSNGWNSSSSWNLNRKPQNNDSIYIPATITIQLQNNITLSNIYLQVSGTLDLDNGILSLDNISSIVVKSGGYILSQSNSDQIKIGSIIKFMGNGSNNLVGGTSIANASTGTYPNGFVIFSILPVTFNSLTVAKADNNIIVKWSTSQEFNNNNFEVQRSFDGNSWTVISIVMGMGTSSTATQYSYTDKTMKAPVAYYRIRQVDMDGQFEYSAVKVIAGNETIKAAKIYAAGKNIQIEFQAGHKNNLSVRLFNSNGQLVAQQNYQQSSYNIAMKNINVTKGIYIVQVADGQGWMESAKIIL